MNEQHSNLSEVAAQITIGVGLGAVVGLVMSMVSNSFVGMVETLTMFRDDMSIPLQIFAGYSFNLVPLGALLVAACLILIVRRVFGITRWHGPADSIFAAHRTDNDLDVRPVSARHLRPLFRQVVGLQSDSMGHLFISVPPLAAFFAA